MFLGGDSEFVVVGVVPDLGHVFPVGDDAVRDGVAEDEDALLGLGLIAHVGFLLVHAHHDRRHLGLPHHRRELAARGVFARQSRLAAPRTVVDHH